MASAAYVAPPSPDPSRGRLVWLVGTACFGKTRVGRAKMLRTSQLSAELHEERHGHDCRSWPAGQPGSPEPQMSSPASMPGGGPPTTCPSARSTCPTTRCCANHCAWSTSSRGCWATGALLAGTSGEPHGQLPDPGLLAIDVDQVTEALADLLAAAAPSPTAARPSAAGSPRHRTRHRRAVGCCEYLGAGFLTARAAPTTHPRDSTHHRRLQGLTNGYSIRQLPAGPTR
jgi:hypothetical protein